MDGHEKNGTGPSGAPAPMVPSTPTFAAKADDLEAIRTAVADAAGMSAGLWLSYLFALFYLLIAAGAVTHRDLFLENPIKLPFLGIELPLKGFFWLGPALFLVLHGYVLLHFVLFSSKAVIFDAQLRTQIDDTEVRARLRWQLPINIFVQYLAGPREARQGPIGFLLRLITWISLVVGPVALLVFFELQFLPYHDVWVTMWQRVAVVIDLILLWLLWPAVLHGELAGLNWRSIGWRTGLVLVCASLASVTLVFAIATFPGEWLEAKLAWFPLRTTLVAGNVSSIAQRPLSLWSNRLALPGFDVIDHTKFDTDAKIAAAPELAALRMRHLEGAVLSGAVLRKVDFSGADLTDAYLDNANLTDANLDRAYLNGADLGNANLTNADLDRAYLNGANLAFAHLPGALLSHANLTGAHLPRAHLPGANLDGADLTGAYLDGADLTGANLNGARLPGVHLYGANLTGAHLDGANLTDTDLGADLHDTQLPGTNLDGANLNGAKGLIQSELDRACGTPRALPAGLILHKPCPQR